jgi:GNAT superfamily N-acetyltransferase
VRLVRPSEYEQLGDLTVRAYRAVEGLPVSDGYERELRDVAARASSSEVLVALGPDGELLGGVAFVAGLGSPMAEFDDADAAGFRMLAVDPDRQSTGAGRALVRACMQRAQDLGRARLIIHTTQWMRAAHRLYESMGFVREPTLDWLPEPNLELLAYRVELRTGELPADKGGAA